MEIAVVLHNIRSLHNVGSIFRTADAAGVKKVYLCGITPSPLDRFGKLREQFKKVSLGAEMSVQWDASASHSTPRVSDPMGSARATLKLLEGLKNENYEILAVEQSKKAILYNKYNLQNHKHKKIVLIFGNEIKGIPLGILKKADKILEIPMGGKKESLNVAVAFGVVLFGLIYALRKR